MSILAGLLNGRPTHAANGRRTRLRPPQLEDFRDWQSLRRESRSFLEPWEPTWPDDDLLSGNFRRRIGHYAKLAAEDLAYPFFIFDRNETTLLGGLTFSNVRRGAAQMATLGYWIGAAHANQGYMTDALQAAITFAREDCRLHRLEAACLPANAPSIQLLQRAGFQREGFARDYLKINGRWEDHILWGLPLDRSQS
jgi:[ribosomal protein S5]-alanine N-acetyltransferase